MLAPISRLLIQTLEGPGDLPMAQDHGDDVWRRAQLSAHRCRAAPQTVRRPWLHAARSVELPQPPGPVHQFPAFCPGEYEVGRFRRLSAASVGLQLPYPLQDLHRLRRQRDGMVDLRRRLHPPSGTRVLTPGGRQGPRLAACGSVDGDFAPGHAGRLAQPRRRPQQETRRLAIAASQLRPERLYLLGGEPPSAGLRFSDAFRCRPWRRAFKTSPVLGLRHVALRCPAQERTQRIHGGFSARRRAPAVGDQLHFGASRSSTATRGNRVLKTRITAFFFSTPVRKLAPGPVE